MKIKVSDIPEEGLSVDFERRIESMGVDSRASVILTRIGVDVIVSGQVDMQIPLECGRCLGEFSLDLSTPVELTYTGRPPEMDEEVELSEEDLLRVFMDDEIDLGHLVEEQALLNIPMRPLCSEECKGLCPKCGADLNIEECQCPKETGDPRMQVLRKLLNKGENK